jgi:dnaJ domain
MDLASACRIFDISTNSIKEDDLRKKYRELIKLNHPDNNKSAYIRIDEIKKAKDLLENYLRYSDKNRDIDIDIIEISLEDLIKVYEKKEYKGISLGRLLKSNAFVEFKYCVKVLDSYVEVVNKTKYNREDKYSIIKELDISCSLGDKIEVSLLGEKKGTIVNGSCIRLNFNLPKNISVDLSLYVKLN